MTTNSQLQHDVQEELQWEPSVDATQIGVTAKDGVVTLTGATHSYTEKLAAERVVKKVYGVRGVANDIEVNLPGEAIRNDAEVATAALSAIAWDARLPEERIQVTVRNGWITLEGAVEWGYQKEAALRAVRNLMGVKGVTNSITVKAKASKTDIKDRIHASFTRNAELDSRRVGVDVHNGTVKLHGNVRSWAEKREAEEAAWAAAGVTEVENKLSVTP